jgi:hypothetical protein
MLSPIVAFSAISRLIASSPHCLIAFCPALAIPIARNPRLSLFIVPNIIRVSSPSRICPALAIPIARNPRLYTLHFPLYTNKIAPKKRFYLHECKKNCNFAGEIKNYG